MLAQRMPASASHADLSRGTSLSLAAWTSLTQWAAWPTRTGEVLLAHSHGLPSEPGPRQARFCDFKHFCYLARSDVLLHTVTDAILGALCLPDIG